MGVDWMSFMLGILFTILKILLWTILGILGLFLVLLLLVLVSPIRYKVDLDYHEKAYVVATVKFLIVKAKVIYDQKTKEMKQIIRVFGFRIGGKRDSSSKDNLIVREDGVQENSELPIDSNTDTDSKTDSEADIHTESCDKEQNDQSEHEADDSESKTTEQEDPKMVDPLYDLWDEEFSEPLTEGEKHFFGRVIILLRKIINGISKLAPSNIITKFQTKKAIIDKKINRIKKFWNLSCTVKTRAYLKKYLSSVLKHILPRKAKGFFHYGFEEPYKTGQITGYLSLMPFMYQKHLSVQPDFYNNVIEADLSIKGKIRIGYLLRIALNINIWRTLKALKRITK